MIQNKSIIIIVNYYYCWLCNFFITTLISLFDSLVLASVPTLRLAYQVVLQAYRVEKENDLHLHLRSLPTPPYCSVMNRLLVLIPSWLKTLFKLSEWWRPKAQLSYAQFTNLPHKSMLSLTSMMFLLLHIVFIHSFIHSLRRFI